MPDAGLVAVFAVIVAALVLFATEPVPIDATVIGVMVTLMILGGAGPVNLTGITVAEGLSGVASTATITVLATFVLSEGVQRTGVVQLLGARTASYTGDSELRQPGAIIGVVGPISGFINNTAAVAILLSMSYASTFGGVLTLIGTSTDILASAITADLAEECPGAGLHAFSMFEFTALGALVMVVGSAYLLTVGRALIPAGGPHPGVRDGRVPHRGDRPGGLAGRRSHRSGGPRDDAAGRRPRPARPRRRDLPRTAGTEDDPPRRRLRGAHRPGHAGRTHGRRGFDLLPRSVDEAELEAAEESQNLVEVVVAPRSTLVGKTPASARFRQRYDATVLALRRGPELVRQRIDHAELRVGDTLLVQATGDSIDQLNDNRDFIVAQEVTRPDFREDRIPVAVGLVVAVVGVAALDVPPIAVAALGGALGMVLTGCLKPTEISDAVHRDVISLLAGAIPLDIAVQRTGGADLIARLLVDVAGTLPPLAVLGLLYLVTAPLTDVISDDAAVVLMLPVAVEAATRIGADAFALVLGVTFAASTAFMTPVGYRTNLFVYGPGGYRFTDYVRVGRPLQLLFAVVTTLGIALLYGPV